MWSALIATAITAAAGLIKAGVDKNTADKMVQAQYDMTEEQIAEYNRAKQESMELWEPYQEIGQMGLNELAAFDDSVLYDRPEYSYDKTVEDFLDPYRDFAREQTLADLEQSASVGGTLGSGGTLDTLIKRSEDYANQDWGNAYNRMIADDATKYGRYIDKFNNDKALLDYQYNQIADKINLGITAKTNMNNAITGASTNIANTFGTQGDLNAIQAQNQGQFANNMIGGITNAVGTGFGAYNQYSQQEAAKQNLHQPMLQLIWWVMLQQLHLI